MSYRYKYSNRPVKFRNDKWLDKLMYIALAAVAGMGVVILLIYLGVIQ